MSHLLKKAPKSAVYVTAMSPQGMRHKGEQVKGPMAGGKLWTKPSHVRKTHQVEIVRQDMEQESTEQASSV